MLVELMLDDLGGDCCRSLGSGGIGGGPAGPGRGCGGLA